MHRTAGNIAAKAEGSWFVSGKCQGRRLTRVGFDKNIIAIDIKAMDNIGTDKAEGYNVALIDLNLGGRIGILPRINFKGALLRRGGRDWQGSERHYQSRHYKEDKR